MWRSDRRMRKRSRAQTHAATEPEIMVVPSLCLAVSRRGPSLLEEAVEREGVERVVVCADSAAFGAAFHVAFAHEGGLAAALAAFEYRVGDLVVQAPGHQRAPRVTAERECLVDLTFAPQLPQRRSL